MPLVIGETFGEDSRFLKVKRRSFYIMSGHSQLPAQSIGFGKICNINAVGKL